MPDQSDTTVIQINSFHQPNVRIVQKKNRLGRWKKPQIKVYKSTKQLRCCFKPEIVWDLNILQLKY